MSTVADLIEHWLRVQSARPTDQSLTNGGMARQIRDEMEAEEHVAVALSHYGSVVYGGKVWSVSLPPRTSKVIALKLQFARDLAWPPPAEAAVEPIPEKLAGFICEKPR